MYNGKLRIFAAGGGAIFLGFIPQKNCGEKPLPKYGPARYLTAGGNSKFEPMRWRFLPGSHKIETGQAERLAQVLRSVFNIAFCFAVAIHMFIYMCRRPFLRKGMKRAKASGMG